jgi:UDP-N-acetyl-D-mannosaminuronate dehydrogenase
MRESPALDIIQLLERRGAKLTYSDLHVHRIRSPEENSGSMIRR